MLMLLFEFHSTNEYKYKFLNDLDSPRNYVYSVLDSLSFKLGIGAFSTFYRMPNVFALIANSSDTWFIWFNAKTE